MSLWRHRICRISHSLLVFTTRSRRPVANRSATFLRCLHDWHLAGKFTSPFQGGADDVCEVEPGMPTRDSNVQHRHFGAVRKTKPMRSGCAIGTRGGCWGDGRGCRNIEELVRSGKNTPKVEGMGGVAVLEERC